MDEARRKLEMNDDVLREILVHLPPKSVFRFLSVSKTWKKLIADPLFYQRHSAAAAGDRGGGPSLVAFFRRVSSVAHPYHSPSKVLVLDQSSNNTLGIRRAKFSRTFGDFINSSDGLILCGRGPYRYHVINPLIGRSVSLSVPRSRFRLDLVHLEDNSSIGLMCLNNNNTKRLSASFVVVRAEIVTDFLSTGLQIQIYSSGTGRWVGSTLVGPSQFVLVPEPPLVANGFFHWFTRHWEVAVYDARDTGNHQVLQLIKLPILGNWVSRAVTRSSLDNTLWFGIINLNKMQFYRLPKGKEGDSKRRTAIGREEWELIYEITIDLLCEQAKFDLDWDDIWRIKLEAFVPRSNPLVVVIRQRERIYLYNIESRLIELVPYNRTWEDELHSDDYCLCPYIEPLSLSSYKLVQR